MKELDILYVVGDGSLYDDAELRYSLRSIEKNCEGFGRVFIVGKLPRFVKNVVHIPCDDPYDEAHKNIAYKIAHAVHNSNLSEDFAVLSDDHFYVRPYDFRTIAPYCKGDLPVDAKNKSGYWRSLTDTRRWLTAHGYPAKNGSQHCGHWYKRSLFLQVEKEMLAPGYDFAHGIEPHSVMLNAMRLYLDIKPVERKDIKIIEFKDTADLKAQIGGAFCFSISDSAMACGLKRILGRWYPKKSRWEK
jgi:hypothetical protein